MTENIQLPVRHGQFSGSPWKAGGVLTRGTTIARTVVRAVKAFVNTAAGKSASTSKTIWSAAADGIRRQALEVEPRRQAELAAQRLAAIVESSDDAIVASNLDGVITNWNDGAQRLFGYTTEEVVGKATMVFIPPDRVDEESAIVARIRNGERVDHYETVRRRKDGSLVEISLTVSPIKNAEGKIVGVSKIARDITDRKRTQEQQRLLLREMNHRVKNVFAISCSLVTLSARTADTPERLASAVRERLGALARAHVLTLSNPSDGSVRTEQPTTLHALIDTIVSPYEDEARARVEIIGLSRWEKRGKGGSEMSW